MTVDPARTIPLPIKREVRQRCGFGCVICGSPLVTYEHMTDWAIVQVHEANNITLLCPNHHAEKTLKIRSEQMIRESNSHPHNRETGYTAPYTYPAGPPVITVGPLRCVYDVEGIAMPEGQVMPVLMIDEVLIFGIRIEDNTALVTLALYNELDQLVLLVVENELVVDAGGWDVECSLNRITFRTGKGEILAELHFDPDEGVKLSRGRLLCNGVEVMVWPDTLGCVNNCLTVHAANGAPFASMGNGTVVFGNGIEGMPHAAFGGPVNRYDFDRAANRKIVIAKHRAKAGSSTPKEPLAPDSEQGDSDGQLVAGSGTDDGGEAG